MFNFATTNLLEIVLSLFALLVAVLLVQDLIYRNKARKELSNVDALEKAVSDQESSAKMLVRRDLELTRANDKLRELDEAKSNFISVVAHQLRTPLSGVKWTLNMVLNENLGPLNTEQKSFLMKCYESNERMIILINDMLNADRIDSGKMKYNLVPTQLADLADNILFEMSAPIDKKHIQVKFLNRDRSLPNVLVDSEKMRAVLQNLLENAVKYTPQGGTVEVDFQEKDGYLEVSIKDSGIGIPDGDKHNVFNRFFRAKNAIKIVTDGSGLGLFISKGIIEEHGGRIWFESEENKGTKFFFTVPITR